MLGVDVLSERFICAGSVILAIGLRFLSGALVLDENTPQPESLILAQNERWRHA
tara:strand:+ start:157 stop:318 length:162 start_codon:yes stop_codon:yes gene_type:complete